MTPDLLRDYRRIERAAMNWVGHRHWCSICGSSMSRDEENEHTLECPLRRVRERLENGEERT